MVQNGQVRGFETAFGVEPGAEGGLTLQELTVRDNGGWLSLPADTGSRPITVERATLTNTGVGGGSVETRTTVRDSVFVDSGIWSYSETWTYVYDSTFIGGGVHVDKDSNIVAERNRFSQCDVGIQLLGNWPGSPTIVRDNVFVQCRVGLQLETDPAGSGPSAVRVTGNAFLKNAEEGFRFEARNGGEVEISGNLAVGNGGTGIVGERSPATFPAAVTVADNTARNNGGHGIDVAGAIDGGGNVAKGNDTEPQCVGVPCAVHP